MRVRTKQVISLIALLCLFLLTPAVKAVESNGVGGKPANPKADNPRTASIFVYDLKPGESVNDAINLFNNSDQDKVIGVYAVDSIISSDGAFACEQEVDERNEVGSWIKLDRNEASVAPNQTEKVGFVVNVPVDAEAGEYNGCIAIQDKTALAQNTGNGISLNFRSAVRVAITVPGNLVEQLEIKDTLLEVKDNKLIVSPILKNSGNVSLDALISVKLNGLFGQKIGDVSGQFAVLAKSEGRYNFDMGRPFWGGWYKQVTDVSYKRLSGDKASEKQLEAVTKWHFIMPRPTALVIEIIALALIITLIKYVLKNKRQKEQLKQSLTDYKVKKNEHLEEIAKAHNINWKTLARINGLSAPYRLATGQTIKVPKKGKDSVKTQNEAIRAGETPVSVETAPEKQTTKPNPKKASKTTSKSKKSTTTKAKSKPKANKPKSKSSKKPKT